MASLNKTLIIGNLGRDPEVRYSPAGAAVCNITVATTSSWKDKESGEKKEETEWHRVVFYGRLAEIAGEYLKKGRPVYIEGRLKTRKWQNKEGQDVYTTEIIADQMQMLGGRDDAEPSKAPERAKQAAQRAPASGGGMGEGNLADISDDIPFVSSSPVFDIESRLSRRMRRHF